MLARKAAATAPPSPSAPAPWTSCSAPSARPPAGRLASIAATPKGSRTCAFPAPVIALICCSKYLIFNSSFMAGLVFVLYLFQSFSRVKRGSFAGCSALALRLTTAPRIRRRHHPEEIVLGLVGEVHRFVVDYGYLSVFLGILLEDFGLPTPGETMLIAGSVMASRGSLNILWLLPIAWLGAVIGDSIGFFIGATGGHRLLVRYGSRIGITHERLQKVEEFFARYGDVVVLFARFFVILRQFNGIVAGSLEMPWPRFLFYNEIGAALWVGFWGGLTYWLGRRFFDSIAIFGWIGPTVTVVAVITIFVVAIYLWRRHNAAATKKSLQDKAILREKL